MKEEYNLDAIKFRPSIYRKLLTEEITIQLENEVIDYFKEMAKGVGLPLPKPHQSLPQRVHDLRQRIENVVGN